MVPNLTIVGVGLLGGSVALAARQRNVAERIVGVDSAPSVREQILMNGIVDTATADLVDGVREAHLVVFCTPVDLIAEQVALAANTCRPGTLFLDVGSTKASLVQRVEANLVDASWFVGCHPLAGSERSGPGSASGSLFQDRIVVLTPTQRTNADALSRARAFWTALGAEIRLMSPEQHDQAMSLTSHLPHLVASVLAGILPPDLFELAASGFRDTTRIAAGSPALWTKILSDNRQATLAALDRFQIHLQAFAKALRADDGDTLLELLQQGKQVRDALGRKNANQP